MSELHLGKLIKTLGKKCPECMDSALQVRLRSFENKEQEYEYCPNCQYENVSDIRRRVDDMEIKTSKT